MTFDTSMTASLGAALLAGVAASGHCVAMCGGIAGAMAMRARESRASARFANALAYNLSRVASYCIAGALAGLMGSVLLRSVDVPALSIALRVLSGLIMLAAAGKLLLGWRLLDPVEAAGSGLWRRVAPWAGRQGHSGGLRGAIGLGLAWGWLPCGMTYSMLLLAATTGGALAGASVMLAFGAGTLPSMLTTSVAFDRAARALSSRATVKRAAGILLLAFGLWTAGFSLYQALATDGGHAHHQPVESADPAAPAAPAHHH